MNRKPVTLAKPKLTAILIILLFCASMLSIPTFAAKPDMKTVKTIVGSYPMDGKTVYFVSHVTGVMKWIAEPTEYIEWQGQSIPINGEFWIKSSSYQGERRFSDDSYLSIMSMGSSFVGTFEVVPTPPEFPWLPPYMPMPKDAIMNSYTITKSFGELGTSKYHTIVKYVDFIPQVLLEKTLPPPQPSGQIAALFTGVINDYGLDEDEDALFEYLVVSVEVRVRTPGFYNLVVLGLEDSSNSWINVYGSNYMYLGRGTRFVDVLLDGPAIYLSGLNPSIVPSIELYDEYFNSLGSLSQVPLSREYSFEEFERPPASLTGIIYDEGIDTDADGTFDYLEIGVEVNVLQAGTYYVYATGLYDNFYNRINVLDSEFLPLEVGIQVVTLTFNGPSIYASGINPSLVDSIYLNDQSYNPLDARFNVPLSREYLSTEFDAPGAYLTGTITDQGVDIDSDGYFDYLEIGVQVEVSIAGTYTVTVDAFLNENYEFISVWTSNSAYLNAGTQTIDLQIDGVAIYMQGLNPISVRSLSLQDDNNNEIGRLSQIPLSRTYLYTEFDASP